MFNVNHKVRVSKDLYDFTPDCQPQKLVAQEGDTVIIHKVTEITRGSILYPAYEVSHLPTQEKTFIVTEDDIEKIEEEDYNKINYRLILNEMLKGIDMTQNKAYLSFMDTLTFAQELRTIGIKTTRQTGKTLFFSELVNEGEALLVVLTTKEKETILENIDSKYKPRVFTILELTTNIDKILPKLRGENIKYICLDQSDYFKLTNPTIKAIMAFFKNNIIFIKN